MLVRMEAAAKFVGDNWVRVEMLDPAVAAENLNRAVENCVHELVEMETNKVLALWAMNAPNIAYRPGGVTPSYSTVLVQLEETNRTAATRKCDEACPFFESFVNGPFIEAQRLKAAAASARPTVCYLKDGEEGWGRVRGQGGVGR